jgi:hypothetical protein
MIQRRGSCGAGLRRDRAAPPSTGGRKGLDWRPGRGFEIVLRPARSARAWPGASRRRPGARRRFRIPSPCRTGRTRLPRRSACPAVRGAGGHTSAQEPAAGQRAPEQDAQLLVLGEREPPIARGPVGWSDVRDHGRYALNDLAEPRGREPRSRLLFFEDDLGQGGRREISLRRVIDDPNVVASADHGRDVP